TRLAKTVRAKYAVAVANGTAALHLAAIAIGLKPGDEVITTPISFIATSNAALYVGAKPVFVDIDPETQCLDPKLIEAKITPKTKAVFVTDFAGHPADLRAIYRIAQKHHLIVVEDACHALGATYNKHKVGACTHSDLAVFSFHPVKHITTGEGGAITTNNRVLYERLTELRTHGVTRDPQKLLNREAGPWYYEMQNLGFNYRMTDIQAALGIEQLKKLGRFVARRRKIAARYRKAFHSLSFFKIPNEQFQNTHVYHIYPIRLQGKLVSKRKEIFQELQKRGLGVQVHYIPIPSQPYYAKLGYSIKDCPKAEAYYRSAITIPIFPKMTDREIGSVIKIVASVVRSYSK
ncbi:MAG TPA: UDP-4-amino-4,6-dideoxy-N-acetyl-beta-L-altrosamine transaminase, partial [Candidatus Omnitrophota bacterium]|nr:UDP-4-amino-4,6-dideoxy-N-acetyl-beta-L-altrosamine transaminase [Candidatus Omnitrophota bacterium]